MRSCFFFAALFAACLAAYLTSTAALADDGSLSPQAVDSMRSSFHMDDHARAMYNAVTSIDISQLSLNRDIVREHNDLFGFKIKTAPVTNQQASGRCWMFAGLNTLRPEIVEKHKLGKFELSQSYLAFWDKMEKSNCFMEDVIELADRDPLDRDLQLVMKNASDDGGWWDFVPAMIKKYGAVPQEIMPETHSTSNTAHMNHLLSSRLKVEAVKLRKLKQQGTSLAELRADKDRTLADIYRILVINMGEPPKEFTWRFEDKDTKLSESKSYTPLSFAKEWNAEINTADYMQIGNVPGQDYEKMYELSHSRNIYESQDIRYLNMPIEVLKAAALKSVLAKEPVWFAADVAKDQDVPHGIMQVGVHDYSSIFGTSDKLSKAERWQFLEGYATHAMVFMGVDMPPDVKWPEQKAGDQKPADQKPAEQKPAKWPTKWLVENSWGKDKGHDGYWSLYDNWFNEHLYFIVVKKAYVPKEIVKLYEQKPVVLPRWHPMAQLSD